MKITIKNLVLGAVVFWSMILVPKAFARAPEDAEFYAAERLGQRISEWIADMENRPESVGVFSVHSNFPLENDYSSIVETELVKGLAEKEFQNVMSCTECRLPQVTVADSRLIVTKGAPDLEVLKKIGERQPVQTFLTVDIYRTKISILAHVVLYENPTGKVIAAERFRIPAVTFADSSVQVLLAMGIGRVFAGIPPTTDTGMTTAFSLALLEELGFGKGGVTLGTVMATGSPLIYVNPTFGFRGRFGSTALAWALTLGVGYGFTPQAKGISFRGAYDIFLGSWALLGGEVDYFLPDKTTPTTQGYAGFHIGISLGR